MTPEEFRDLVTRLYLEHGVFHTIKQMAKLSGVPEHRLRKGAHDVGGYTPKGIQYQNGMGSRPSRSYGPTLRHLRDLLNAAPAVKTGS